MHTSNYVALMGLFLLSLLSCQNTSYEEDAVQIEALIQDSFDGLWSTLDSKQISRFYTDDFLLLENGEVWNNDTIAVYMDRAILNQPIPTRLNYFDFIDLKINGSTAWVAYHNRAVITLNGDTLRIAQWLESATAIKTDAGWKLDMLHSTRTNNTYRD